MKIKFFFLTKLSYYVAIFSLMRYMSNHFAGKEETELIDYWEVFYKMKIKSMLNNKANKFFNSK
jgi:hypothetical protein